MNKLDKIYIAGHTGMVGSAIVRRLMSEGFKHLILKTSKELDLRDQQLVDAFFEKEKPDFVFLAAAKVGGILANKTYRADFLYDNLMIQANIINAAYQYNVKKLLFLGSSCIYPKMAKQPMVESALLSGLLAPTNEPYAIAKIAGIKLCETFREQYGCNFISAMPTNLYGPNDNYDAQNSHIIPALLRKFYEAKLESRLEDIKEDLDVAVIGCYVNGPGESKHTNIGVTGGSPKNLIYIDGKPDHKVDSSELADHLENLIRDKIKKIKDQETNLILKS